MLGAVSFRFTLHTEASAAFCTVRRSPCLLRASCPRRLTTGPIQKVSLPRRHEAVRRADEEHSGKRSHLGTSVPSGPSGEATENSDC